MGKQIIIITLFQALGAFVLVSCGCFLFFHYVIFLREALPLGLLLGAICCATAPAGVFAVIEQYKAKGNLTSTLLAIVAIDDAICIVVFGVALAISTALLGTAGGFSWPAIVVSLREVGGSLLLGALVGVMIFAILRRLLPNVQKAGLMMVGFALLGCGAAQLLGFSPLLTNMTAGFLIANLLQARERNILRIIKGIEGPIFILFFTLAGSVVRLDMLEQAGVVVIIYVIARWIGKIWGASLGARIAGAPRTIRKWLGLGLIPQAGVAIALTYLIRDRLPALADLITVIVLASIVIDEIIGPIGLEIALKKSCEAQV